MMRFDISQGLQGNIYSPIHPSQSTTINTQNTESTELTVLSNVYFRPACPFPCSLTPASATCGATHETLLLFLLLLLLGVVASYNSRSAPIGNVSEKPDTRAGQDSGPRIFSDKSFAGNCLSPLYVLH